MKTLLSGACAVLLVAALVLSPAFGGEPEFFLPGMSKDVGGQMCSYPSRGVTFVTRTIDGPIDEVAIYKPVGQKKVNDRKVGPNEIVPGVGAFGLRIGDSVDTTDNILAAHSSLSTYNIPDDVKIDRVGMWLEGNRKLFVFVKEGKITGLVASGPFRSEGGLTEKSSQNALAEQYGLAEIFWMVRGQKEGHLDKWTWPGVFGVAGLGGGLFLGLTLSRRPARSRAQDRSAASATRSVPAGGA